MMRPSRRTQPYRSKAPRPAGSTLAAMLRGRQQGRVNPQEPKRQLAKMLRRGRRPRKLVRSGPYSRRRSRYGPGVK